VVVTRLRKRGLAEQTAVLLFSAVSNDRESARRAFDLGAVDFIAKPYDPHLLRSRIQALVRLCRRREPVAAVSHAPAEPGATGGAATAVAVAVIEEAECLAGTVQVHAVGRRRATCRDVLLLDRIG
jgi:DNA-binding response OmpR family regulator